MTHDDSSLPSRRSVLAAVGLAATGGCVREVQSAIDRDSPKQLSLTIKTVPADADAVATTIARFLSSKLKRVGIDASVVLMSFEELLRDVLVNQSFDLYVARYPARHDPDFVRPLTHSQFGVEPGWQNPFGYSSLGVDDLLEKQARQTGNARNKTLFEIQRRLVRDQPFSVVAFPDEVRATRSGEITGWVDSDVHSLASYLSLTPPEESESTPTPTRSSGDGGLAAAARTTTDTPTTPTTATPDEDAAAEVQMTLTDDRPTKNLNPLAVEFRREGTITGLLYDSLARYVDGSVVPWLAESWEWRTDGTPSVDVRLRSGLSWHDGEPLTAEDAAFTYRFLADTSLGTFSSPVPAPRFRSRTSLVDSVEARGDRTVRISFGRASRPVAAHSLTVPLLPRHVWEPKAAKATVAGIDTGSQVTKALVWNNPSPVGSGPFRFRSKSVKESVVLEPNTDHFLVTDPTVGGAAGQFAGGFAFDRLVFAIVPSSGAAVELLQRGQADGTASPLDPSAVPEIGRSNRLDFHVSRSQAFYHVGFNVRKAPLGNPRFRRAVARLIDKQYLVDEVFKGYAKPASSPLAGYAPVASDLVWSGTDPKLPFAGADGSLDVERAREFFRKAGYRYTNSGKLVYG